jgi:MazG family protein
MHQWEQIKRNERADKKQLGVLDGIAKNLPSLKRSQKIQKRASKVGFDWPDTRGVFEKIKEETHELEEALLSADKKQMKEEIGDLLMIITNLAQKLDIDSEDALNKANNKFMNRFSFIEKELKQTGKEFDEVELTELDSLWEDSKKLS